MLKPSWFVLLHLVLAGRAHDGTPSLTILPLNGAGRTGAGVAPANNPLSLFTSWAPNVLVECQARGIIYENDVFPTDSSSNRTCVDDSWIAKCYLAQKLSKINDCDDLISKHKNLCQVWPETIQNYCCHTEATSAIACQQTAVPTLAPIPWNKGVAQMYLPRGRQLLAEAETTSSSDPAADSRELRKRLDRSILNRIASADVSLPGLKIHLELKPDEENPFEHPPDIELEDDILDNGTSLTRWNALLDERDLSEEPLPKIEYAETQISAISSSIDANRLSTNAVILFPKNLKLCSLLISAWKTMRLVASLYDVRQVIANRQWLDRDSESAKRFIDQFGAEVLYPTSDDSMDSAPPRALEESGQCEAGFVKFSHQVRDLGYAYASGEVPLDEAHKKMVEIIDDNFTFLIGDLIEDLDYQQLKQTLRFTGFVSEAFLVAPGCWIDAVIAKAIHDPSKRLKVAVLVPHVLSMLEYLEMSVASCEDNCLGRIWEQVERLNDSNDSTATDNIQDWFLSNIRWLRKQIEDGDYENAQERTWGELIMTLAESFLLPLATSVDETQKFRADMALKFFLALNKDVSEPVPTLGLEVHRFIRNVLKCSKQPAVPRQLSDESEGEAELVSSMAENLIQGVGRGLRRVGGFFLKRDVTLGDRLDAEESTLEDYDLYAGQGNIENEFVEDAADLRLLPKKVQQNKYAQMYEVAKLKEKGKQEILEAAAERGEVIPGLASKFTLIPVNPQVSLDASGAETRLMAAGDALAEAAIGPADSVPVIPPHHNPPPPQYNPATITNSAGTTTTTSATAANGSLALLEWGDISYPSTLTSMLQRTSSPNGSPLLGASALNDPLVNRLRPLVPINQSEHVQGFQCVDQMQFMYPEFVTPWIQRANCFDLISAFGCRGQRGGDLMPLHVLVNACPHTWVRGCSKLALTSPPGRRLQMVLGASVDGQSIQIPREDYLVSAEDVYQAAVMTPIRDCLAAARRNTQQTDTPQMMPDIILTAEVREEYSDGESEKPLERIFDLYERSFQAVKTANGALFIKPSRLWLSLALITIFFHV